MFCPNCGATQTTQGRFCERCGRALAGGPGGPRRPLAPVGPNLAAVIGALAAVVLGVLMSYLVLQLGIRVIAHDLEGTGGGDFGQTYLLKSYLLSNAPRLSFLDYYGYQQISCRGQVSMDVGSFLGQGTAGASGTGDIGLSVPVLGTVLVPILAICAGAYLAAALRRSRSLEACTRVGMTMGCCYAALMVLLRPLAAFRTEQMNLPIPIPILGSIPIPSVEIGPGLLSTLFHAALFGIIFGLLGARIYGIGWRFWRRQPQDNRWRDSLERSSFSWAGLAVALGLALSLLTVVAMAVLARTLPEVREQMPRSPGGSQEAGTLTTSLVYLQALPALSGAGLYFAHGINLAGEMTAEAPPRPQRAEFSLGLLHGASATTSFDSGAPSDPDHQSLPAWAFLFMLIPAISLVTTGYRMVSSRGARDPGSAAIEGMKLAGPYTVLLLLLRPLFGGGLDMSFGGSSGNVGMTIASITASFGPTFFGTVFWGLVWGAVMGGVGGALAGVWAAPAAGPTSRCPRCSAPVRAGSRFCQVCGRSPVVGAGIPQAGCPHCAAQEPAGTRFCSKCGHSMSDAGVLR